MQIQEGTKALKFSMIMVTPQNLGSANLPHIWADGYGADATLSAVDIVISKGKNVILAIEIEESAVRPKTIIGDIFGIALADRMRIQRKLYSIKYATIIVAIADDGKGKQSAKYVRLERYLNRYFKANPSKTLKGVRIIPCPTCDLVRRIERLIRLEAGKQA